MLNNFRQTESTRPALPQKWIVPIRLTIYAILAACSAYVYFNYRELEITHFFIGIGRTGIHGYAVDIYSGLAVNIILENRTHSLPTHAFRF